MTWWDFECQYWNKYIKMMHKKRELKKHFLRPLPQCCPMFSIFSLLCIPTMKWKTSDHYTTLSTVEHYSLFHGWLASPACLNLETCGWHVWFSSIWRCVAAIECAGSTCIHRGRVLIIVRWWTESLRLETFTRPVAAWRENGWVRGTQTRLSFVVWERVRWKIRNEWWRISGQLTDFMWQTNILLRL